MTAQLLDGKTLAASIRKIIADKVKTLSHPLQLAVILVGNDSASEIYVRNKHKACTEVGITSTIHTLPASISEAALCDYIEQLNQDEQVHGILLQLPLPAAIDNHKVLETIAQTKDVDGFHPYNIGRLIQRAPTLRPCTPFGIIQLLKHYHIPMKSQHAVIIGASNIVGRPMALEFLLAGSTVTICHRLTKDLAYSIKHADIIVSATGVRDIIDNGWLNSQQTIIDVGMHRLSDGSVRGDVDFDQAFSKVKAITPVPGGVGPMTIAMLLYNTLKAAGHTVILEI